MIFSHEEWGCSHVADCCQNGPLAPFLKACLWTDSYNCWSEGSFCRPFLQTARDIDNGEVQRWERLRSISRLSVLLRASDFSQCLARLERPVISSFEKHSRVNDSRWEQCHVDDFADEVIAQALLFCCLELIALFGSGIYACWETWCQFRVAKKPTAPRSHRYHRINRRQMKAIVLIFLCLDFVGVRARIHAETYALSSDIQPTRKKDNTVHHEAEHEVMSLMERSEASDLGPLLQESESGTQDFQSHLAAVHGAVVLGREAEVGDFLRAFLTESAVRLPEVDPLVLDTYFVSRWHRINKTPRRISCYKALNWQNALLAAWLPRGDNSFVTVFMAQMHSNTQEGPELLIIPREDDLIHARPFLVDVMAHITVRCGVWAERNSKVRDIFLGTEFDAFCNHHCQMACWNGNDFVIFDWEDIVEARAGAYCKLSRAISCAGVSRKRKAVSLGTTLLQNGSQLEH